MKIAIIGAGLIGQERIEAIGTIKYMSNIYDNINISAVFDTNFSTLEKIQNKYNVPISYSLNNALQTNPDWVFVCVPHDIAPSIIKTAFSAGANVLAEKPLGRSLLECESIINNKPENLRLNVGFNYRFYDGISNAIFDYKNGKFGKLISVNMILAHGNSPNMNGSWKLDPIKDGGVIIDIGGHLFDLSLQLAGGNLKVETSKSWKGFWNTGIEDEESHIILTDDDNTIFNLQVSLTRWKNIFKLEINGTEGYGIVEGRGKNYGTQTYRTGERWGWDKYKKNQADTEVVRVCDTNTSFIDETLAVLKPVNNIITPCNHIEVIKVMQLLEQCKRKGC
jgi:predicted dehydrogenase